MRSRIVAGMVVTGLVGALVGTGQHAAPPGGVTTRDAQTEHSVHLAGGGNGYYYDFNRKQARRHHDQWSLRAVGAAQAWARSRGAGVTVAVIDSGIGPTWELRNQALPGLNLAGRPPARIDVVDHGTAVASLIAARADGQGITGVAPEARLLPVRIFDSYESPRKRLIRGIHWAVSQQVDIINLSLVERDCPALRAAIRSALRRGIVVVAGSGNERESGSPVQYPAAYPGVIAVGAVRQDRTLASFSNEGRYVDVVAPGARVLAADPFGTLSWYSGTSFSTPVVSGVVALMKAAYPGLSPRQAQRILGQTARDLGDEGRDELYGFGLVDAGRAVRAAARLDRAS